MAVQESAPTLCPICAENLTFFSRYDGSGALSRPCCKQLLCQNCLFRHIQSVFGEGIAGGGRNALKCPLGCNADLDDSEIRMCLKRAHSNWLWLIVGRVMFSGLKYLGWYEYQDPFRSSRFYSGWNFWNHTPAERNDLLRYEQWCMAVALRKTTSDSEVVMSCPAPDCGYVWISSARNRRRKFDHENRRSLLWYRPPPPEEIENPYWVVAEYLNPLRDAPYASKSDERDGRRMVCAKCHCAFCGLCRRPWETFSRKRRTHAGVSCKSHIKTCGDTDYAFVAQIANTMSCPGCSLRTSRIDGCNHMTCPCGTEWCYVCECRWNVTHYSCVERRSQSSSSAVAMGCTVS